MARLNDSVTNDSINYLDVEEATRESYSVHWRAIFTGVFVAMLGYLILMALGVAIGSGQAVDVIRGQDSAMTLGTTAGIWVLAAVLISLFMGSYASGRVSGIIATRVGYTQGAVVAALFFALMISQVGATIGFVGSGIGAISRTLGSATNSALGNPQITSVVEDALGDINSRTPLNEVVSGVVVRLSRGDEQSAINYLSARTGVSREEANARYANLKAQVEATATRIGEQTAQAASTAGWMAFGMFLLGTIAALFGGGLGAQMNLRKPIDQMDQRALDMARNPIGQKAS